jgi:calcineurin-like phosphoesterase family protein
MKEIYVISDTHFGHANILEFTTNDGKKCREFASVEEMDECIVTRWNEVVRQQDIVYHLGDVAMKRKSIAIVGRCNGHKRLITGNHDIFEMKDYLPFFKKIMGFRKIEELILTHIPIHPESLRHNWINVHGHVHNNVPRNHYGPRYINVSVEVTDYRPVHIDVLRQLIHAQLYENTIL